jgi:type VI secretion system protein ImpG
VGRVDATLPAGFCRGLEVTVELDPQNFIGTGTYLFACVLERFLGAFTSINSFSQLVLRLKGSDEIVKRWPPRAGDKQLL